MLSEFDRLALVDHAEHLVALRGGEAEAVLVSGDASESRLPASGGSGWQDDGQTQTRSKRDGSFNIGTG